ncbi:hypothetical protein DL768_007646 [Monosporascus sp. mg162]|nr:hypothetical protein DL768_007646 [Monosporascus sp. mg162]
MTEGRAAILRDRKEAIGFDVGPMGIARYGIHSKNVVIVDRSSWNLEYTISQILKVQALLTEPPGPAEHGRNNADGAVRAQDVESEGWHPHVCDWSYNNTNQLVEEPQGHRRHSEEQLVLSLAVGKDIPEELFENETVPTQLDIPDRFNDMVALSTFVDPAFISVRL